MFILMFIVLVVIVIAYYNAKAKYQEAHPRPCAKCGKMISTGIELSGSVICKECGNFTFNGKEMNFTNIHMDTDYKRFTWEEVNQFLSSIPEREAALNDFNATAVSPLGKIKVDEAKGLILVDGIWVHKISDVKSFKTVYDFEPGRRDNDPGKYTGGHILIKYNDFRMSDTISTKIDAKLMDAMTIHEVNKAYDDELKFLEKVTHKSRGMAAL